MPTTKELREQRANVWSRMTEIMDRPSRTGDDDKTYDGLEVEYDKLDRDIDRQEKHERVAAQNARLDRDGVLPPDGGDSGRDVSEDDRKYNAAFASYLAGGRDSLDADERVVMRQRFSSFKNAAGVGTGAAGGYTVPPEFRDIMVETMKWYGPMLAEAEVITTDSGAQLPWPTNDDTANVGAILAENTAMSEQDVTIGTANIDAYMYTSKLVRASYQLMQDNPNFARWLARKLGERIGRIWNQHFTTGTGTSQPDGIVTGATVGATGTGSFATLGGFSYDTIIDLEESLDPAYGGGPVPVGAVPAVGRPGEPRRVRGRAEQRHGAARGQLEVDRLRQHQAGVRHPQGQGHPDRAPRRALRRVPAGRLLRLRARRRHPAERERVQGRADHRDGLTSDTRPRP
jgi:HK97 family phage major capsid protein